MNYNRIDTAYDPDPGGSGEVLLADSGSVQVVFHSRAGHVAIAKFHEYAQLNFGYPNDEASGAIHPELVYGFYEVLDSDWSSRLNQQNSLRFPGGLARFNRKHFIAIFHETTLQVLAQGLSVEAVRDSFSAAVESAGSEFAVVDHGSSVIPVVGE